VSGNSPPPEDFPATTFDNIPAGDRFVQFRYEPDYLTGKYRHLRADGEIGLALPWLKNCVRSSIVLDGGNVVGWGDKVILTEKIFEENRKWEPRELVAELKRLLEVRQLILIPPEPGDVTGHADGVVRFVDHRTVVASDFRGLDPGYRGVLRRRLKRAGLEVIEVPYRPDSGSSREMPSAVGNYLNFLRVGRLVVVPAYGLPEDEIARTTLAEAHPGVVIEALSCQEHAAEGGVLNCSTWSVRETTVKTGDVPRGSHNTGRISAESRSRC
jgi:agmatine deiminase